jgi:formimidoylglutamase
MAARAPHTIAAEVAFPVPVRDPGDPRLAERLHEWRGERAAAVLVGVPYDDGVVLGGGRAGAAAGPTALRRALARFGTTYDLEHDVDFSGLEVADAGDVQVAPGDVRGTHERAKAAVFSVLSSGATAIVAGGGNDVTFASVCALMESASAVGGINVDAHLDVRPVVEGRITSGTPYRRLVEEAGLPASQLVAFGLHTSVNARAHLDWFRDAGARCIPLAAVRREGAEDCLREELERLGRKCDALFVSVDLDVFAGAYAPAVSAPGTEGLTAEEGRALAHAAGRAPKVRLFELMELSPPHDIDQRTARLAALLVCAFLSGLARREGAP